MITGGGHALDQVMLYCAADKLFLSADQVLSKISPNVSVWAVEPEQNSLGDVARLPADVHAHASCLSARLVMPSILPVQSGRARQWVTRRRGGSSVR